MKEITEYFRNVVAASSRVTLNYKDDNFCTISFEELKTGCVSAATLEFLWINKQEVNADADHEEKKNIKNIMIALKTVATEFEESEKTENNIEEMLTIFFLPVRINRMGDLIPPDEGKMPWIPREFLKPMEDPQIAVGEICRYDEYLEITTDKRNQIDSWKKYLEYAIKMYEYVTEAKFEDQYINKKDNTIKLDGKIYLFLDTAVYASFHIMQLYNDLRNIQENKLYAKLTNGRTEPEKKLILNTNINKMKKHVGQIGGEYPLSPSQREAINHFNEIEEGDILAVSGPPGTGKTTLLQSVVANMYVDAALKQEKAPIIVAASTNNQAVTNIIDSLKIEGGEERLNLEKKWITGSNSFAVYFPSKGKMKEAEKKGYQCTTVNGEAFFDKLESVENRAEAKESFLKECRDYFGKKESDLSSCSHLLWKRLHELNTDRIKCLSKMEEIKGIIGKNSYETYICQLESAIQNLEKKKDRILEDLDDARKGKDLCLDRCIEWRNSYSKLPWYIRLLKFLPCFRNKISIWKLSFIKEEELHYLKSDMKIEEIESIYHQMIIENENKIVKLKDGIKVIDIEMSNIKKKISIIEKNLNALKVIFCSFEKYRIMSLAEKEHIDWKQLNVCELNDLLDRVRYIQFWLAVHYYESRWLLEENPITERQKGKTFESVLNIMYHRLAMISPCMVMTFYMLPKQFRAYDGNNKKQYYLYNYIDVLIVDEAGQISPEVAAPSFSLAKKAIVVGDEKQIPPVWGIVRPLDIAMAISSGVIKDKEQYETLELNGLNCSQSSIMKIAVLSSTFHKYRKGLFLSEHRRCYDEIIDYCNKLVYEGKLEPKRGSFFDDSKNAVKDFLPAMGHKQITVSTSQKSGTSRQNKEEAKQIVDWLKHNYSYIVNCYGNNGGKVVGVITPFKSQCSLIKTRIKKEIPYYADCIDVGTVHTFQGAERKVIIFSSVYGNEDGCFFINKEANLMNVAVSRAKDSFLVFGDRGCLVEDKNTAAGLLKFLTKTTVE